MDMINPYAQAAKIVNQRIMRKKYIYVVVIQQNYGFLWEDVSSYPCNALGQAKDQNLLKTDFKALQRTGWATRQCFMRIKNPLFITP